MNASLNTPPPAAAASSTGRTLRTVLKIGVSALLLAVLFSRVDWGRAWSLLGNVNPWPLLALLALYAADRVLMALKWHQLLHVLDTRLSRRGAIRVYYESSFVGFAMPLGGLGPDIVRFMRLRAHDIPAHITLVSILVERYVGLIATMMMVVVGFTVLAVIATEPALVRFAELTAAAALATGVVAAIALLVPSARRAARRLIVRSERLARAVAKHTAAAAAYAARRRVLAVNFALSLLEQTAAIWAYWLGSRALGTPLPLAVCVAVAPVVVVIQRLPISYGGLGLREGSAAALLVALGYDYSESIVLMMLLFITFLVSLLPGLIVFKRQRVPSSPLSSPEAKLTPRA